MERNRIYLKFLNVNFFRPQFIYNLASSAADYQHGRPVMSLLQALLFKVVNWTSLSGALINHRPWPLQKLTEIKSTKRYKRLKYIYIYSKKRFASLLKVYSIFRNSSIVKRKPKFLWMGLVIFFVEWTLLKVQFGLFNHIGIQHWLGLREGAFFPGGGGNGTSFHYCLRSYCS